MLRRPRISPLPAALLGAVLGLAAYAPAARACGGFFCDVVNNQPLPVDQTGENIVFAIDRKAGTVEAHIQIQYTGDPQKFAWIIPVTAIPDFSLGSEQLFTNLLASTVPTYSFNFASDCEERERPQIGCATEAAFGGDGGTGITGGDFDTTTGGFDVVKREIVGAFEIVVLSGGTAEEVYDWLSTNGYYQDMAALPIIDEYLKENFYLAAAKLLHGAGTEEIQPLVMTYAGDTPCVPLRLTRIAATPNMGVRVFGLGEARYVPSTYRHVEINDAALDWTSNADNYTEVVREAIDTPGADGRAFVTEFAGSTGLIDRTNIYDSGWRSETFIDAEPVTDGGYTVVDALQAQGLVDCTGETAPGCVYLHPQILPLLRRFLPAPDGIAEDDFYACMACFEQQIDPVAWNSAMFAQQLEERVIAPGKRAIELLSRWPKVSRLLTIISPEEMTVDPEFIENPDLPDVTAARTATRNIPCEGSDKMALPSGEAILLTPEGTWPNFDTPMPFALRIEQMTPSGAPQVIEDFKTRIRAAAKASNERFEYDDGRGVSCTLRRSSWSGAASLAVIFAFAWRGRRRRR